ncbi:MAG TPA: IgGFc-binding protein [Polyangiaceae bacterium]|nr:IgGFc-binding protein [Polyangiaceae bacterium]
MLHRSVPGSEWAFWLRDFALSSIACAALAGATGCSAGKGAASNVGRAGAAGTTGAAGTLSVGTGGSGSGGDSSLIVNDGGSGGSGATDGGTPDNPATCDDAKTNRTYVGCEFWPTITYNPVYTDFDFAVVIANGGDADAQINVTGPAGFTKTATVTAGGLTPIILPWVPELKGPEFSRTNTSGGRANASVRVNGGAYHVTSSVPVTAWQFNTLEYQKPLASVSGGCGTSFNTMNCFSTSNDASLLLPSSAMTGNYRVISRSAVFGGAAGQSFTSDAGGFAITAVQDSTQVTIQFPKGCGTDTFNPPTLGGCLAAGTGVTAALAGATVMYTLNTGDVLELLGELATGDGLKHADLSGTVINANAPVQVISFNPITNIPDSAVNADHIEEIVLPAEVIGNEYIVAPPTSPSGMVKGGHMVRIYGNVDATHFTYPAGQPTGAPMTINAGAFVEIGPLTDPFVIDGDQPFVVGSFMVGGSLQAPAGDACPDFPCRGDPAMTIMVTPKQFRQTYTFLAPSDYETSFADILVPDGATATLDGAPLGAPQAIGTFGWGIVRAPLDAAGGGVHKLATTDPKGLGLQVMGFGHATSYEYPGGLNLKLISTPPVIPVIK